MQREGEQEVPSALATRYTENLQRLSQPSKTLLLQAWSPGQLESERQAGDAQVWLDEAFEPTFSRVTVGFSRVPGAHLCPGDTTD